MNTFQNSAYKTANCTETNQSQTEHGMIKDVRDFFSTDSCAEIIDSMNALLETVLFSKDVENVTPEMRVDIANQLRAVTLISKLNEKNRRVSC